MTLQLSHQARAETSVCSTGTAQSTGQTTGKVGKLTEQEAKHSFGQNAFFSMLYRLDFHTSTSIKSASLYEMCLTCAQQGRNSITMSRPALLTEDDEQLQGMPVVNQLYNLTIMSTASLSFISSLKAPVNQKEFN